MDVLNRDDNAFMRMALREAQRAFDADEVPVGAIVVLNKQVIARAHNQVELLKDATAHAEMLAITQAASTIGDWRLNEATLYVTKEPCAMCAGAMVNTRLKRVVFGVTDPRSGAAGSALDVTGFPGMLHRVDVLSGVMQEDCLGMLQDFFAIKRREAKEGDA
jgi:tRNA(adenine34) deaminase